MERKTHKDRLGFIMRMKEIYPCRIYTMGYYYYNEEDLNQEEYDILFIFAKTFDNDDTDE